jgi:hypothetical protein
MPTVFRAHGFRFYFVSHDLKEPPHVHVERGGAAAKFWLERCQLARNGGFPPHQLGDVLRLLRTRRNELLEAWHDHFGTAQDG